jgi:tetratricopeptide (TPR) repeat protein
MSSIEETRLWLQASKAHASGDYDSAIDLFSSLDQYAKVCYNLAILHSRIDNNQEALNLLDKATSKDPYLAIAYMHRGFIWFSLADFELAELDFSKALKVII